MENIIQYGKIDGRDQETKMRGAICVTYSPKIFSSEVIEIKTTQLLNVGDRINTEDGIVIVQKRTYIPKEDIFEFFCGVIFSGREI